MASFDFLTDRIGSRNKRGKREKEAFIPEVMADFITSARS